MKVKELVSLLLRANQEAEINVSANMSNQDDENCDVQCELEVFGEDIIEELSEIEFVIIPKHKSSGDFETVYELLGECEKVIIELNKDGIYIFGDGEMRRELDFDFDKPNNGIQSEYVNKLIEVL